MKLKLGHLRKRGAAQLVIVPLSSKEGLSGLRYRALTGWLVVVSLSVQDNVVLQVPEKLHWIWLLPWKETAERMKKHCFN